MLKSLEIENFKAFGKRVRIEFAPITLIFGENSAGKSTILQSLNLLKQSRNSREFGTILLPRTDGGFSDLGSFQELLFDHETQRNVIFKVEFDKQYSKSPKKRYFERQQGLGLEMKIGLSKEQEIEMQSLDLFIEPYKEPIATYNPCEVSEDMLRQFYYPRMYYYNPQRIPKKADMKFAKCVDLTEETSFWEGYYKKCKKKNETILEALRKLQENVNKNLKKNDADNEESNNTIAEIHDAILFYNKDYTIRDFIGRMKKFELCSSILLDGFIPQPTRYGASLPELIALNDITLPPLSKNEFIVEIDSWMVSAGRLLESALSDLFPMGPFRRPPERWYIYTGTKPQDVGYKGDLLPDLLYRNPGLLTQANEWLHKLNIGYAIEVKPVGTRSKDLFELQLRDVRRKKSVEVGLTDVGFGISQLLPFVVQCLASENQIISIEQPEVHIHPRLQADIGDLLVDAIKDPRNNRFIIETHSEHLILRLQRLVREGKLSPEDISVIYVSRKPEGANVQRLRLDSEGMFLDEWPGGFFPERIKELL